jgi:hypothetical protein
MFVAKKGREHLNSVNETYLEHARKARGFSFKLFKASFACLLHAYFPGVFTLTASTIVKMLYQDMVTSRVKIVNKRYRNENKEI